MEVVYEDIVWELVIVLDKGEGEDGCMVDEEYFFVEEIVFFFEVSENEVGLLILGNIS